MPRSRSASARAFAAAQCYHQAVDGRDPRREGRHLLGTSAVGLMAEQVLISCQHAIEPLLAASGHVDDHAEV
jgi:hypothetical protein